MRNVPGIGITAVVGSRFYLNWRGCCWAPSFRWEPALESAIPKNTGFGIECRRRGFGRRFGGGIVGPLLATGGICRW